MKIYKALIGVGALGMASLVGFRLWGKHDKDDPVTQPIQQSSKVARYVETFTYVNYNDDNGVKDLVSLSKDLTMKVMIDGGKHGVNDGLVDFIAISAPELYLSRKQDYENYKEKFDEADRLLAEIKERARKSGYPSMEE